MILIKLWIRFKLWWLGYSKYIRDCAVWSVDHPKTWKNGYKW
jgi:hypothetical protein